MILGAAKGLFYSIVPSSIPAISGAFWLKSALENNFYPFCDMMRLSAGPFWVTITVSCHICCGVNALFVKLEEGGNCTQTITEER